MGKAYSIPNVIKKKFKTLKVGGEWEKIIGTPELTGSWLIYGGPKNGKTSFAMQLSKYLAQFGRVAYNSVEEGLSLTMQKAIERNDMIEVTGRWTLIDKEDKKSLISRLEKQRAPEIIIIDSVQFWGITIKDYKELKMRFPDKLFIYISHIKGNDPDGTAAIAIKRDANVVFKIEGFRAFTTSRYGGEGYLDVWAEKAAEYWDL